MTFQQNKIIKQNKLKFVFLKGKNGFEGIGFLLEKHYKNIGEWWGPENGTCTLILLLPYSRLDQILVFGCFFTAQIEKYLTLIFEKLHFVYYLVRQWLKHLCL